MGRDLIHWGNPLAPVIEALRDPLFTGRLPTLGDTIYTVVAAVVSLALGAYVFSRVDDRSQSKSDPGVVDPRLVAFRQPGRQACDFRVRLERGQ